MNKMRQAERRPVLDTKAYWMSVISFKRLDWTELIAKLVDISSLGVGIEARNKVEPGFVWFSEKVDGSRGGLLMWSKQLETRYRGGIKFVPLPPDEERSIQRKLAESGLLKDPTIVVDAILASLKRTGGGPVM